MTAGSGTPLRQTGISAFLITLCFIFLQPYISFAQPSADSKDPFLLNVAYKGEFWGNFAGGADTGIRYLDNLDVNLEINFGALPLGLKGTTVYVYGLGNQGGSISELVGDVQGLSNIETANSWRIFEVWAQKKFFLANSSILVGLYDMNSEFNVLNSSLVFINSSHGLDAALALSGVLGPSTFPYTSVGSRIKINPLGGWVLQAAVLDGIPSNPANPQGTKIFFREQDGLLFLAEMGLYSIGRQQLQLRNRTTRLQHLLGRGAGGGRYKFALGGWAYSKKREGWKSDGTGERDMGVYGLGEYQIYLEPREPYQGLTIFGRASITNEKANRLAGYIGGGLLYHGLFPERSQDEFGIAIAHAINSSIYREQSPFLNGRPSQQAETGFELTYMAVLTSSVSVQGDVQYIINPNMNPNLDDALAAGLRLLLSF